MPPPVRVLELLGPPGSGKSTLAATIAGLDGCTVVKVHERGDLPVLLRAALASRPVFTIEPPPGVSRLRWIAWAGRLTAAGDVVRRRAAGGARVVVLDQGPAYTLARLTPVRQGKRGSTWWDGRLRACADLLDTLVLLDADRQTLLERVHTRPKRHAARELQGDTAERYFAEEQHRCQVIATWLEFAGVRVVRLDTARMALEEEISTLRKLLLPGAMDGP